MADEQQPEQREDEQPKPLPARADVDWEALRRLLVERIADAVVRELDPEGKV